MAAVSVAVHVAKRAARCFAGADGSRNDAAPRRVTGGMMKLRSVTLVAAVAFAVQVPTISLAAGFSMKAPSSQNSISGRVASYDGKTALGVRTNAGRLIAVRLQDGTVISPRGAKLKPGMTVTVVGSRSGATFAAQQIVAPLGHGNGSKLGNGPAGERGFYRSNNPDFYPQHNGPG